MSRPIHCQVKLKRGKTMSTVNTTLHNGPTRWIRIPAILILHAATLMLLFAVLCKFAPGISQYYQHANIQIPSATHNVVWLSDVCCVYFAPIFCLLMFGDFVVMFVLSTLKCTRRWPLSAYSQMFVLSAMFVAVYAAVWLGNPIAWLVP